MINSSKKKILIIDDDLAISKILRILLDDLGYCVKTTNTAINIDKLITKFQPHIILLDLWLPVVDGAMVLAQLKADKHLKKIPVILISASYDAYQTAYKLKADGFLAKPFDIDDVLAHINRLTF